ncbi:GntR family transcriptional regulator [Microvirga sp. VF16]|uniref:GntR family transcriptional regulator n=1 Tax=Microvirga sp. VF16 TaxID=2807101 RepID=UPI00193E99E6|nr:GntR family transcriptional regulator [Microvirga sp. VF16]QRM32336.1 GntR family transcriptional regulator [Microvirga sp. VF16]
MTRAPEETVTAKITRILAERIVSGALAPGEKLRQDHVAAEFDASHVPVREAFRRLEAQGLAVSEPRRGVRVASFDPAEVREVAEMRAALEALALRHAAPHLTTAILNEAEKVADEADRCGDIRTWEAANRRFHRLLLAPCRMPRLLAAIDDLQAVSARFLFASLTRGWQPRTDVEHRTILAALRRGDLETACTTLARHVQRIGQPPKRSGAARQGGFAGFG